MVIIVTRKTKFSEKYYLEHSTREGKKIIKHNKLLGNLIPENIEEIKILFMHGIYRNKWFPQLDRIKNNYDKQQSTLPKSVIEKQKQQFSIKYTYNTNRIEGSTLTLRDTSIILVDGISPSNKPINDIKEVESHNTVFLELLETDKFFDFQLLLYWHYKLLMNSRPDIAGKIRDHGVSIAGSSFQPPSPVELTVLLNEFYLWYKNFDSILHTVELAALVHLYIVTIHPFADGNGRISRLCMNYVLHKGNFPLIYIDYKDRRSYYTALERSQIKKQPYIFVQYLIKRYIKYYKKYI